MLTTRPFAFVPTLVTCIDITSLSFIVEDVTTGVGAAPVLLCVSPKSIVSLSLLRILIPFTTISTVKNSEKVVPLLESLREALTSEIVKDRGDLKFAFSPIVIVVVRSEHGKNNHIIRHVRP